MRGVLNTTLCDKVCQWFSPGTPVSSTNKTDRHDIIEILLKVVLNLTITVTNKNDHPVMFLTQYGESILHQDPSEPVIVSFYYTLVLMYSVPEQSVHGVYNKLQNNLKKILNPML
jgi:hypothetical protein